MQVHFLAEYPSCYRHKVKTAEEGEKRLEQLARSVERDNESAARSLREGMARRPVGEAETCIPACIAPTLPRPV